MIPQVAEKGMLLYTGFQRIKLEFCFNFLPLTELRELISGNDVIFVTLTLNSKKIEILNVHFLLNHTGPFDPPRQTLDLK